MKILNPKVLKEANLKWGYPEQDELFQKWKKNLLRYARSLPALQPRLSKQAWKYFKMNESQPLFDANLISFTTGDVLPHKITKSPFAFSSKLRSVYAEINFLDFGNKYIYTFRYRDISHIYFTLPREHLQQLTYLMPNPPITKLAKCSGKFDSLFAEEISSAGRDYLRHELFFISEAVVAIEFKKISVLRQRIR
jgi:hypothetical protein